MVCRIRTQDKRIVGEQGTYDLAMITKSSAYRHSSGHRGSIEEAFIGGMPG